MRCRHHPLAGAGDPGTEPGPGRGQTRVRPETSWPCRAKKYRNEFLEKYSKQITCDMICAGGPG